MRQRRGAWLVDVYRFNLSLASPATLGGRVATVARTTSRVLSRRWVLFRPDLPDYAHVIYKICLTLGYRVTTDPRKPAAVAIRWKDATFSSTEPILASLSGGRTVVNLTCDDISKDTVDRAFGEVFNYRLAVDPRTHVGQCVRKSNLNARHDGTIVECPRHDPEAGYVYQRLVDNEVESGMIQDIRAPVFRGKMPFVYLKYRPVDQRFSNTNTRVELAEAADVLSQDDQVRIARFCGTMGLDYGELDILRDRADGRLYVVDVNTTPWGPPNRISENEGRTAVRRLAQAFAEAFLPDG